MGNNDSKKKTSEYQRFRNDYFEKLSRESGRQPKEIFHLMHSFHKSCPSGHMTKQQFSAMLSQFIPSNVKQKKFTDEAFRKFDFNQDGTIDFQELLIGLSICTRSSADQKIKMIFDLYDRNKDGHISKIEMEDILEHVFEASGISKAEAQKAAEKMTKNLFKKIDESNDNKITFEEFKRAFNDNPKLQTLLGG